MDLLNIKKVIMHSSFCLKTRLVGKTTKVQITLSHDLASLEYGSK